MDLVPQDVARWRREMVNWTKTSGADWYQLMIELGQQNIRPAGNNTIAAAWLAQQEINRLTQAELRFFECDTCDIVSGAFSNMPPFAPVATDLPTPYGFVMFAKPIMNREATEKAAARDLIDRLAVDERPEHSQTIMEFSQRLAETGGTPGEVAYAMARTYAQVSNVSIELAMEHISDVVNLKSRERNEMLLAQNVQIYGASWSPANISQNSEFWAGGVWISFYSASNLESVLQDPELIARCRQITPRFTIDNEVIIPWCPDGADRDAYMLDHDRTTHQWALMLFAAFRIARQRTLCAETMERCQRGERRRSQRDALPPRDITVVRLRPRHTGQPAAPGTGTKHSYRYPVAAHWRQQWYPSIKDHRPILILPHIRGPEGAELRHTDRVTVL